ncbi:MAG: hypothetical protein ABEK01_03345 [Candidatus Nanohaloarchaea archaeon]
MSRPGELGDSNWRPSTTGSVIGILVTAGFLAAVTALSGIQYYVAAAAAGSVVLAVAVRLDDLDTLSQLTDFLSALLMLPASFAIFNAATVVKPLYLLVSQGSLGYIQAAGYVLIVAGSAVASFGAAVLKWDSERRKSQVQRAARKQMKFLTALGAILAVFLVSQYITQKTVLSYGVKAMEYVTGTGTEYGGVIAGALLFAAYWTGRLAWRKLPFNEAVPRRHEGTYSKLATVEKYFAWTVVPLTAGAVAASDLTTLPAQSARYASLLSRSGSRTGLLQAVAGFGGLYLGLKFLKSLNEETRRKVMDLSPYLLLGSAAVAGIVYAPQSAVNRLLGVLPGVVASGYDVLGRELFLGMISVAVYLPPVLWLGSLYFLEKLRFMPSSFSGASMSAAGIFVATMGAGVAGLNTVVVFAGTALTLVAWETGRHSSVLGSQIGKKGVKRQSELTHDLASLSVGALAVGAAIMLTRFSGDISGLVNLETPAAVLALAAVALLATVLERSG